MRRKLTTGIHCAFGTTRSVRSSSRGYCMLAYNINDRPSYLCWILAAATETQLWKMRRNERDPEGATTWAVARQLAADIPVQRPDTLLMELLPQTKAAGLAVEHEEGVAKDSHQLKPLDWKLRGHFALEAKPYAGLKRKR